jgi:hypothetical protein
MRRIAWFAFLTFLTFIMSVPVFAAEPVKVCIAQLSGPEAKNWKLQAVIAKRMEEPAISKQLAISAPLLTSDDEKHAKSEAAGRGCGYIVLATLESIAPQVYGTFNPNPTGRSAGDLGRSLNETPRNINLKYKLIAPNGQKIQSSSIVMDLKDAHAPADYDRAARKLVDDLAIQVIGAVEKPQ